MVEWIENNMKKIDRQNRRMVGWKEKMDKTNIWMVGRILKNG